MNTCFRFLLLTSIFWHACIPAHPQGKTGLKEREAELNLVFNSIRSLESDSEKLASAYEFQKLFRHALGMPGSFTFAWDSLKNLAKIMSPDGKFRIYNWNIPLSGGRNRYFCLLQFDGKGNNHPVIALQDASDTLADPEHFTGDSLCWYGALYYRIIPFMYGREAQAYILLGWDGMSEEMSGKIIEVLSFGPGNRPQFAGPPFRDYGDGKLLRVLFRFSASARMTLKYQDQSVPGKPVWNAKKREYEAREKEVKMIVFDHLVPMEPGLEGVFRYYVPSSETAAGFVYENREWKYTGEFDARNP